MKTIKKLLCLLFIANPMLAYTVKATNNSSYKVAVDFLDVAGNSHATMLLDPKKDDERGIGGWCTEKIRVTLVKPNGGYGGWVEVKTPGKACEFFQVKIVNSELPQNSLVVVVYGGGVFGSETGESLYTDLLKVITQSSIIANKTSGVITLFNAPSLGTGATDGVPVNPGAMIPFYLNAGSAGEELVIKGNGAGIVSCGNDYANHKTTWISSKNISKFSVINGEGAETNKRLNAQGQLVIDPLERLDITTPAGEWEIKLKVAEEIK